MKELGLGKIATVLGKVLTWTGTSAGTGQKGIRLHREGGMRRKFDDAETIVRQCHAKGETDEFIVPRKAAWYNASGE
jgi:hypothetical protein